MSRWYRLTALLLLPLGLLVVLLLVAPVSRYGAGAHETPEERGARARAAYEQRWADVQAACARLAQAGTMPPPIPGSFWRRCDGLLPAAQGVHDAP